MGVNSELADGNKHLLTPVSHLALLTGQQPQVCSAKMSVAQFKVRQGAPTHIKVTLRGDKMWNFLERMVFTALPRLSDFDGLSPKKGFDGHGGWAIGFDKMTVFPDIVDTAARNGMLVTISTNGKTDEEALRILTMLGMPFKSRVSQDAVRWAPPEQ